MHQGLAEPFVNLFRYYTGHSIATPPRLIITITFLSYFAPYQITHNEISWKSYKATTASQVATNWFQYDNNETLGKC